MEDREIVALYWDRDPNAISETDSKYGGYCKSIAKNILGSNEDAEECVNGTYLNAWSSIPPHRPDILSTYLGKITRNLSFDRYRHKQAEKRGGGEIELVLDELAECVSGTDSVEQEFEKNELVRTINSFLTLTNCRMTFGCQCQRNFRTARVSAMKISFAEYRTLLSLTISIPYQHAAIKTLT